MGDHTLFVPNALFAENRRRLCQRLKQNTNVPQNSFILLQGGEALNLYDTDVEYIFRQVVFVIHYWVGDCPEPASYVAVTGLTP